MLRAAIHLAVQRAVRPRFALSLDDFAEALRARIPDAFQGDDAAGYVSRLCLDDLYLAVACSRGDERAWGECRDRYFEYIRSFTKRLVHDRAASDVADSVIADLWQRGRFSQYDGRSTLRTWLGAVAAHAAINAGRAERRTVPLEPEKVERLSRDVPSNAAANPAEDHESHRLFAGLVAQALGRLDAESKLLLMLYYEQSLTLDQLAPVLGASKATLSRRLDRLRRTLRADIETSAPLAARVSADELREHLDYARLELDLAAALGSATMKRAGRSDV